MSNVNSCDFINRERFFGRKRSSGFTHVELMVVAAILGILASISGSAFLYYLDRAKISEASELLSDLVQKESVYFATPRINPATGG